MFCVAVAEFSTPSEIAGATEVATAIGQQTEVIENVECLAHELNGQATKLKETITRFKI